MGAKAPVDGNKGGAATRGRRQRGVFPRASISCRRERRRQENVAAVRQLRARRHRQDDVSGRTSAEQSRQQRRDPPQKRGVPVPEARSQSREVEPVLEERDDRGGRSARSKARWRPRKRARSPRAGRHDRRSRLCAARSRRAADAPEGLCACWRGFSPRRRMVQSRRSAMPPFVRQGAPGVSLTPWKPASAAAKPGRAEPPPGVSTNGERVDGLWTPHSSVATTDCRRSPRADESGFPTRRQRRTQQARGFDSASPCEDDRRAPPPRRRGAPRRYRRTRRRDPRERGRSTGRGIAQRHRTRVGSVRSCPTGEEQRLRPVVQKLLRRDDTLFVLCP